jgi:hypothetical protein
MITILILIMIIIVIINIILYYYYKLHKHYNNEIKKIFIDNNKLNNNFYELNMKVRIESFNNKNKDYKLEFSHLDNIIAIYYK